MISLVITGIVVVIMIVLALLFFPVTIDADSIKEDNKILGSLSISWLILHLRYSFENKQTEFLLFSRTIMRQQEKGKEKPVKPEKTEDLKKIKKSKKIPPLECIINLVGPLLRLFQNLIKTIKFRYLDIDLTYGLEDPAHTGMLTGFFHAIVGASRTGHTIRFTPDFYGPVLDWRVKTSAAFTPIQTFAPVVMFIANRQVLRAGWGIIRG